MNRQLASILLVVSLATQRAVIYRNGIPIGITTVSTGRPGHRTPTGVFTVLQRQAGEPLNFFNPHTAALVVSPLGGREIHDLLRRF